MRITRRLNVTTVAAKDENWRQTCATICKTPSGDLLSAWYGGPSKPDEGTKDPAGLVYTSRLAQGADAWSEREVLGDAPEGISIVDPVLFEYPAGMITAVRSLQTDCNWGEIGGAYTYLNRSTDDGRTWSERVLMQGLPPARAKNQPIVEGATCVFSTCLELAVEVPVRAYPVSSVPSFRDVVVVVSQDSGETWRRTALLQSDDGTCLMEPATVRLSDGRLLTYMRSGPAQTSGKPAWPEGKPGRIWQSASVDGGFTWTEPTRTELPNNNSGFDMCRTADGRLFLAYNNHCRLGDDTLSLIDDRYPLVLAESTDEGKTWRDVLTLDEGPRFEVSYASLFADPDGPLHCVYTWDRRAIKYLSIDVG